MGAVEALLLGCRFYVARFVGVGRWGGGDLAALLLRGLAGGSTVLRRFGGGSGAGLLLLLGALGRGRAQRAVQSGLQLGREAALSRGGGLGQRGLVGGRREGGGEGGFGEWCGARRGYRRRC